MDVRAYARERAPLVERALEAALPPADEPPERLHAAMRHLVFPGGKRLRPVFALAAAEALGAPLERAVGVAAAVELIHTYSLVHDDLPCMDDDEERRGRPTVHVAFDEATAVLAGDALLALAFTTALGGADDGVAPQRRLAAARELAEAAGSRKLVGGQADDLGFGEAPADVARIESIHLRKTAALIAASVAAGALVAGADEAAVARLRRFGEAVGLVFQIADDLLDAGEDDRCSLVHQLGAEAARGRAEVLLEDALKQVEFFGERAEPLRALARFALWRET